MAEGSYVKAIISSGAKTKDHLNNVQELVGIEFLFYEAAALS